MKKLLTVLTVLAATTLSAPAVMAAEVSGNVTLASDYSFRGVSQTMRDVALQGSADVAFESGVYAGAWVSNVDFGSAASFELDLYLGWSGEVSDGINLDVSAIQFQYPGETDLNYQEYALSLGFGDFSLGVNYSPKYLGISKETFFYPHASYRLSVTDDVGIDFAVGLNIATSDDFFGEESEYIDYSAMASLPIGGVDFGIGFVGTDISDAACDRDCEPRLLVSLSKDL